MHIVNVHYNVHGVVHYNIHLVFIPMYITMHIECAFQCTLWMHITTYMTCTLQCIPQCMYFEMYITGQTNHVRWDLHPMYIACVQKCTKSVQIHVPSKGATYHHLLSLRCRDAGGLSPYECADPEVAWDRQ